MKFWKPCRSGRLNATAPATETDWAVDLAMGTVPAMAVSTATGMVLATGTVTAMVMVTATAMGLAAAAEMVPDMAEDKAAEGEDYNSRRLSHAATNAYEQDLWILKAVFIGCV